MARRPPPPFMANAILNFHFDYWNLSLMFSQHAENTCGCRPWHVPSEDGAKMCFVVGNVCFNQASSCWCVEDDFLVLLYLYLINSLIGVMKTAMNDIFMHDQQPVIAMITRSSPWSNLWILWTNGNSCIYERIFGNFIHTCMNSHWFIKFINLIMETI